MAIENGPFIVALPPLKVVVVIFHSYISLTEGMSNYQRLTHRMMNDMQL